MRETYEKIDYFIELVLLHRDMGTSMDDDECNDLVDILRSARGSQGPRSPHLKLPRDRVDKFNKCLNEYNRIKNFIN